MPNTIKNRPGWLTKTLNRVAWYVIGMDLAISLIDTLVYEFTYRKPEFGSSLIREIKEYGTDLVGLMKKTWSPNPLNWVIYPVATAVSFVYNVMNFLVLAVASPMVAVIYIAIDRWIPDFVKGLVNRKTAGTSTSTAPMPIKVTATHEAKVAIKVAIVAGKATVEVIEGQMTSEKVDQLRSNIESAAA